MKSTMSKSVATARKHADRQIRQQLGTRYRPGRSEADDVAATDIEHAIITELFDGHGKHLPAARFGFEDDDLGNDVLGVFSPQDYHRDTDKLHAFRAWVDSALNRGVASEEIPGGAQLYTELDIATVRVLLVVIVNMPGSEALRLLGR